VKKTKAIRGLGSVYQRPGSQMFWLSYYAGGQQIRKSSGTSDHAEAVRRLKQHTAQADAGKHVPRADKVTFDDLAKLIEADYVANGQNLDALGDPVRRLREVFGMDRALSITGARIGEYVRMRLEINSDATGKPLAPASVNLDLRALRRMFNLAIEKEMLATHPKISTLRVNNSRQGFLSAAEFQRLHDSLPSDLKDPVRFLYLSGWRVSEMRSLAWKEVDRAARVVRLDPSKTKTKEPRILPLAGEVGEIIERAAARHRLDSRFVFLRDDGKPVGDFGKSWTHACRAAGLGHVLVHDLRRCTVRNLVQAGIPEKVAMQFTGHLTRTVFDRYHIVTESDLQRAALKLQEHLSNQPQTPSNVVQLPGRAA